MKSTVNQSGGWRKAALAVLALFILNSALSMTNWWPTPFVYLDGRVSPEFVAIWVLILSWVALRQSINATALRCLTAFYVLLVIGRYFDTTAPALFGRAINLYWDGLQIPRLLWVLAQRSPWWLSLSVGLALIAVLSILFFSLKWALRQAVEVAAPMALRSKFALAVTGFLLVSAVANLFGVQATWPYISRPVLPTFFKQARILAASLNEGTSNLVLPASPTFDSNLAALKGADFKLFFFESYGAVVFDKPSMLAQLKPEIDALEKQVQSSGWQVASAFVSSPTFGGGTDLAHMALLSGIDTKDPILHDVLLTTKRPTLVSHFKAKGYQTFGVYPALSWAWPEGAFFGFEQLIDGPALSYQGPSLGYWKIPDQFSVARLRELHPVTAAAPPRMTFFASISSHIPFHPVPPYQPDWKRVLTSDPYEAQDIAALQSSNPDWLNMTPGYVGMMRYNFQWLRGYMAQSHPRDYVLLVMGDHQPASNITGEGASWDVPIHLFSSRPELVERFIAAGFSPGLHASRAPITSLSGLTSLLLRTLNQPVP
jgi:Sulfatase